MILEAAGRRRCEVTLVTFVRSLPGVFPAMCDEGHVGVEPPTTNVTDVVLVSRVEPHVGGERATLVERHSAVGTFVGSLFPVH